MGVVGREGSYVMSDSEPSKSASTKRIETKRQKSRSGKARLLESESKRNPRPGGRYLQAAKGRLQPSNPKRVPGRATVVVERVVRLLVPKVIETKLRHSELVL